jgi:hypothetical protein
MSIPIVDPTIGHVGIASPGRLAPADHQPGSWVHFADPLHGWIGGGIAAQLEGFPLASTDGGATWRLHLHTNSPLNAGHFPDARHGWLAQGNGTVVATAKWRDHLGSPEAPERRGPECRAAGLRPRRRLTRSHARSQRVFGLLRGCAAWVGGRPERHDSLHPQRRRPLAGIRLAVAALTSTVEVPG